MSGALERFPCVLSIYPRSKNDSSIITISRRLSSTRGYRVLLKMSRPGLAELVWHAGNLSNDHLRAMWAMIAHLVSRNVKAAHKPQLAFGRSGGCTRYYRNTFV